MRTILRRAAAAVLAVVSFGSCMAQEPLVADVTAPAALTGTLAKVHASGRIALGYRASSVPLSYLGADKHTPIGYSVELCKALAASIGHALGRPLEIQWVLVTAENRFDTLMAGDIDLECGSTTSNLERQKRAAFSPVIFVAGTKVLVKKGSAIRDFRDLAGKRVAVARGTTNEKAMHALADKFKLDIRFASASEQGEGFALLARGDVDAFAADDALLHGLVARHGGQADYSVLGDQLSYDPVALMFRKDDPQLAQLVRDSFQLLAAQGDIEREYKRWFIDKLPSGTGIGLPMSPQLEYIIQSTAARAH